jgi:hypothetical protein
MASYFLDFRTLIPSAFACFNRSPALLIPILLLSVVPGSPAQDPPQTPDPKVDKAFYTPKDRMTVIQSASIFSPKSVGDANILQGPEQNPKQFQFHPGDKVFCDFEQPGSQMGGKTPKFSCKITKVQSADGQVQVLTDQMNEEPVKVKFGATDNEIYAEVVSTRLMWALGFYADAWFPVQVECNNCPADPESGSGPKETRTYSAATVVRKYAGHKMVEEGKSDEGWVGRNSKQAMADPALKKTASNSWPPSSSIATINLHSSDSFATV